MQEPTIKVRLNGPYLVQGPVVLKDADGNRFDVAGDNFVLCRCGASANKPFCDASHQRIGFQAETRAE